jgi:hypothetical protein
MNAIRTIQRAADPRRAMQCHHLSCPRHCLPSRTRGVRRHCRATVQAYRIVLH